jgi:plasmid maintenance system antidote protein VapI
MQLKNYHKIVSNIPEETRRDVRLSMHILDRIHELLEIKFSGKQKDLAIALGVTEAAISKMINGIQNFNIQTIVKLERVFNAKILEVCTDLEDDDYIEVRVKNSVRKTISVSKDGLETEEEYLSTSNIEVLNYL